MGVLRIYWSMALCEPLAHIYHYIRTVPCGKTPGTNVGWDMICEWLNRYE